MRRRPPAAVLLLAVLATLVVPQGDPAGAQSSVDRLRQERREVQQRRAAQAAQLNVLKAETSELTAGLEALEADRRAKEAEADAARQQAEAQAARAAEAKAAEEETRVLLEDLRGTVRRIAVDEYIRGGAPDLDVETDLTKPMETARRRSLLNAAMGRSADVADRLRQAEEDLRIEREAAESAAEAAAVDQQRAEQQLADLESRVAEQARFAAEVENRLERQLAEADALASLDGTLANRIAAEQAALARRLRSTGPTTTSTRSSGGGTTSGTTTRVGNVSVTSVRGITVASHIADELAALLDAAEADGIVLGGGGYRDSSGQINTRRNNCGSSHYDIYEKPASHCSPPTARPGRSMHERGEAVDFTQNGRILNRSSSGFRWLKANAARYGFYNLPSEPWHWSTNGN